ncbi:MAG: hypothetical protein ABS79_05025 [Planctomycetes bacterium SCN 63-9]|nr:MAG: hypothetical protein ABS79_05025 [Planctomycetes bacterium SCN 63-9]
MFFAYFGPETTLPLASVLAASLGFLMMMGRGSLRFALRVLKAAASGFGSKSKQAAEPSQSRLSTGMRSDRPHRGGEVPSWVRPENRQAPGSNMMADSSRKEDPSSNG